MDFGTKVCQAGREGRHGPLRTNRAGPQDLIPSGGPQMNTMRRFYLGTAAAIGFVGLGLAPMPAGAQSAVAIDNDDIGGTVTGAHGPEAGVWGVAGKKDPPPPLAPPAR